MRKICIFLCAFLTFSLSQTINSLVAVVDKEPITSYELTQRMKEKKLSKEAALNELIDERVQTAHIKKIGIFINDFELERELNNMLAASNSNQEQLRASLQANKQNFDDFKQNFRKNLQTKKLYQAIAAEASIDRSEEGIRNYYDAHRDDFVIYTSIETVIYHSSNPTSLENLKETNKQDSTIQKQSVRLSLNNADIRLLAYLSRIGNNSFSVVIDNPDGSFSLYFVKAKNAPQSPNYEQIKNEVANVYMNAQRDDFIKDFLDKLRAKAQIEYFN